MANTFITNRQMGEAEAYYKILPNLTLKYSSLDTVFIPADKKSLRSKFLMKLTESEETLPKGAKVKGGKEGFFLEKPDIIDKFCRRKIHINNEELEELSAIQFGKMYQPYHIKKSDKKQYVENKEDKDFENDLNFKNKEDKDFKNKESKDAKIDQDDDFEIDNKKKDKKEKFENREPWNDAEDRVANFYITANPKYHHIRLPNIIMLNNPYPGEVPIFQKRSFLRAARIHKKRADTDPHRFFLSELMLYTEHK